jgi:hypothetical protein
MFTHEVNAVRVQERHELLNAQPRFQRFHIETNPAPPHIKMPRPFNPRVSKIRLAGKLMHEVLQYRWKLRESKYRRLALSRPCIYGVFSGRFGGFHPIKDRCTGCMRCVLEYPEMCRVERNPEFTKFADSYWVPNGLGASSTPVATVCYEAETGKIPVKGMGYKGPFAGDGWDSMWTDMSEIVRPTRDGVYGREYISTLVDIGRKPKRVTSLDGGPTSVSRVAQVTLPVIFDYLPPNLNNESIAVSIARAARTVGTLSVVRPEEVASFPDHTHDSLAQIVTRRDIEERSGAVTRARLVEYAENGADPYHAIRALDSHTPVLCRLPLRKGVERNVIEMAREGVDGFHLYADYHGRETGAPQPRFVGDLLRSVHRALVSESLREEVTIIASGGITQAEHVPKAIICGADLVAIDTTILVALQARFEGECVSAETGRIRADHVNSEWGTQRLVNLLASWHDQLIEILSAMGMRDVRRLRGDVGRAMFNGDLEREAFSDIEHRA